MALRLWANGLTFRGFRALGLASWLYRLRVLELGALRPEGVKDVWLQGFKYVVCWGFRALQI